jgi:hypothetical protein
MRFKAPDHISEVFLASGPVRVTDGFVEIAGELTLGDMSALIGAGFTPVVGDKPAKTEKA